MLTDDATTDALLRLSDDDQLAVLQRESVRVILKFLRSDNTEALDRQQVKEAGKALASVGRLRATQSAEKTLAYAMAREVLKGEQLEEYIRVTQPESALTKALPARSK
jgi:hypothetical protein